MFRIIVLLFIASFFSGCINISAPQGIRPVEAFELESYLGTWYEIGRLDHSFEKGLSNVTATYSLRDDGGVKVVNRGFNRDKGEWDEASGKAYFVGDKSVGHLKVSFFGPFYGGYIVFFLDDYKHAFISGPNRDYLWFLARDPAISEEQWSEFVSIAQTLDFDTSELVRVEHTAITQ